MTMVYAIRKTAPNYNRSYNNSSSNTVNSSPFMWHNPTTSRMMTPHPMSYPRPPHHYLPYYACPLPLPHQASLNPPPSSYHHQQQQQHRQYACNSSRSQQVYPSQPSCDNTEHPQPPSDKAQETDNNVYSAATTTLSPTMEADTTESVQPPNRITDCHKQTPLPYSNNNEHEMSKSTVPPPSFKSPITLCFERMLGAADLIASHKKTRGGISASSAGILRTSLNNKRCREKTSCDVSSLMNLDPNNPFLALLNDAELHRQVVLKMALQRLPTDEFTNSNNKVTGTSTISEGFFWRDYPPLESILYDHMADYYQVSSGTRGRAKSQFLNKQTSQISFNNMLVVKVKQVAQDHDLSFDPSFGDKALRDRIRCFYKTHLQNAKKRLATLQKHATSEDHQEAIKVYIKAVKENISVEEAEIEFGSANKRVKLSRSSSLTNPREGDEEEPEDDTTSIAYHGRLSWSSKKDIKCRLLQDEEEEEEPDTPLLDSSTTASQQPMLVTQLSQDASSVVNEISNRVAATDTADEKENTRVNTKKSL